MILKYKLAVRSGSYESFLGTKRDDQKSFWTITKTDADEFPEAGTICFSVDEEGHAARATIRCFDNQRTLILPRAQLKSLVLVQMAPERSEAGYAYVRFLLSDSPDGRGKTVPLEVLESSFGPNAFNRLAKQLARLFHVPLHSTNAF